MSRDDAGQTTLLIVGLAVVLLMAIAAVVDVTAAYLQRQALLTVIRATAWSGLSLRSRSMAH